MNSFLSDPECARCCDNYHDKMTASPENRWWWRNVWTNLNIYRDGQSHLLKSKIPPLIIWCIALSVPPQSDCPARQKCEFVHQNKVVDTSRMTHLLWGEPIFVCFMWKIRFGFGVFGIRTCRKKRVDEALRHNVALRPLTTIIFIKRQSSFGWQTMNSSLLVGTWTSWVTSRLASLIRRF